MASTDTQEQQTDLAVTGTTDLWFSQAWGFAKRTFVSVRNSWVMMAVVVGFPPLFYYMFLTTEAPDPAVKATMALGIGMLGAMLVSLYTFGSQLVVDVENQRYVAYRSMPIHPSADLAGRMFAGVVLATVALLAAVVVALLDGVPLSLRGGASVGVVILAVLSVCFTFMIAAIPIILVADNERYAEFVTTLVAVFAYFIVGSNGVIPGASVVDSSWLNYVPNSLATRMAVYHAVDPAHLAAAGVTPPSIPDGPRFLGLLALYACLSPLAALVLVRTALYRRGLLP